MIGYCIRILTLVPIVLAFAGCVTSGSQHEVADALESEPVANEVLVQAVERGNSALESGEFESALNLFQQVLREQPDNAHAKLGAAESYLGLGLYEEAARGFRDIGGDPDVGVIALQGKGIALLVMGETETAYEALNTVVGEKPNSWRAWNALGRYYDDRAEWADADLAYEAAVKTAPQKSAGSIHNNWGVSLMARGQYEAAEEQFEQAIEKDRTLDVALTNLRLSLAFQGRYAEAMSGVSSEDRPSMLNNLGFIAMIQGDHARAEAYFLRALESSPSFNEAASKNLEFLASMKQIQVSADKDAGAE